MQFQLIDNSDTGLKTVLAFFPEEDEPLVTATSDHPHFTSIVRGLEANDESVYGLFDVATGLTRKLDAVSDRIGSRWTVKGGVLYKDHDPLHDALSEQVIAFLDEGVDDWQPLIRFMERVESNPSEASRGDLYDWIAAGKLTITDDGLIVGYKCVATDGAGSFHSTRKGPGIVDGNEVYGFIPNKPGSVVEMARSKVDDNNRNECSVGLHVGTYKYAEWFGGTREGYAILEVHFDPADAVAVPKDEKAQKIRVCRYKVVNTINAPYATALRPMDDYDTVGAAQSAPQYYDDVDAPDNF